MLKKLGLILVVVGVIGLIIWLVLDIRTLSNTPPDTPDTKADSEGHFYDPVHSLEVGEESDYTWKTDSQIKWNEDGTTTNIPTLLLKGRSQSGVDVLLLVEYLPTGERISLTVPIPDAIPPEELNAYVAWSGCLFTLGSRQNLKLDMRCQTRGINATFGVDVVDAVKGKGYILTIDPKDIGWMMSYLTGSDVLWIQTVSTSKNPAGAEIYIYSDIFTFHIEGFANYCDMMRTVMMW